MKQRTYILLLFSLLLSANGYAQKGIMHPSQQTLMHEVRETPSHWMDSILQSIPHALCGRTNFLTLVPYLTV